MNEKVGGECVISKRWDAEPSVGNKATGQNKSRTTANKRKKYPFSKNKGESKREKVAVG